MDAGDDTEIEAEVTEEVFTELTGESGEGAAAEVGEADEVGEREPVGVGASAKSPKAPTATKAKASAAKASSGSKASKAADPEPAEVGAGAEKLAGKSAKKS
jgi:hypothetical protein